MFRPPAVEPLSSLYDDKISLVPVCAEAARASYQPLRGHLITGRPGTRWEGGKQVIGTELDDRNGVGIAKPTHSRGMSVLGNGIVQAS